MTFSVDTTHSGKEVYPLVRPASLLEYLLIASPRCALFAQLKDSLCTVRIIDVVNNHEGLNHEPRGMYTPELVVSIFSTSLHNCIFFFTLGPIFWFYTVYLR